jgi:hypothetical protein
VFHDYYQRKIKEGRPQALVCVMRRLVNIRDDEAPDGLCHAGQPEKEAV